MANIPKWLEELRRQQAEAPVGAVGLLREAVRIGEPRTVGGVDVPPEAAKVLLCWHDELPPDEQELFAAECNADFRGLARKCLVRAAVTALAQTLAQMLGAPEWVAGRKSLSRILEEGFTGDVSITVLRPDRGQDLA
jgi:hypothetical protein